MCEKAPVKVQTDEETAVCVDHRRAVTMETTRWDGTNTGLLGFSVQTQSLPEYKTQRRVLFTMWIKVCGHDESSCFCSNRVWDQKLMSELSLYYGINIIALGKDNDLASYLHIISFT